jgi:hypothetical protein
MGLSIRIALFLAIIAVTLLAFPVTARADSRFRRAIDAGVAGAVAGDIAGNALNGRNAALGLSSTLPGADAKLHG